MTIKKIFGSALTILGIAGLIYGAILFVNSPEGTQNTRAMITYGVLGFIFLVSGLGLIKSLKDGA